MTSKSQYQTSVERLWKVVSLHRGVIDPIPMIDYRPFLYQYTSEFDCKCCDKDLDTLLSQEIQKIVLNWLWSLCTNTKVHTSYPNDEWNWKYWPHKNLRMTVILGHWGSRIHWWYKTFSWLFACGFGCQYKAICPNSFCWCFWSNQGNLFFQASSIPKYAFKPPSEPSYCWNGVIIKVYVPKRRPEWFI